VQLDGQFCAYAAQQTLVDYNGLEMLSKLAHCGWPVHVGLCKFETVHLTAPCL